MPRGTKKTVDYAEELRLIDEQIAELQVRRNDVLGKKRTADIAALSAFLEKADLDVSDAMAILTSSIAASKTNSSTQV